MSSVFNPPTYERFVPSELRRLQRKHKQPYSMESDDDSERSEESTDPTPTGPRVYLIAKRSVVHPVGGQ